MQQQCTLVGFTTKSQLTFGGFESDVARNFGTGFVLPVAEGRLRREGFAASESGLCEDIKLLRKLFKFSFVSLSSVSASISTGASAVDISSGSSLTSPILSLESQSPTLSVTAVVFAFAGAFLVASSSSASGDRFVWKSQT